ncbi:putative peptidyl-prolyl cis-trans isomerase [Aspergillus affinis]|uniref:putative peptidyl-prolyl cis-trans isomerase n=1 Tax=Aspergillus affinis TaxID=1070780 RepID=UPI0022FE849F|nr:putative peptidyl-prolyl cis-trans isomerase [Aspergillus affinis]KAI9042067.1 putative peptidyl-prolyl cis-trans isomerase [Aspergillus affinis]
MSSHYTTEPPATASATLHTTFGPLHIALFANQTPLTCRNFLQHCKDNYYAGTIFHRIEPDFIIQGGDPTGTGSGGTSIYEDREFEYDPDARDPNEKVVLRDELHSRLRFNRRGLVGMAKSEDGTYGSQFFITLANTERELNGQCTMFGRIEGDSIYNVVKIAEAERVEGTDRPVYPVKVTSCEVGELGPLEGKVKTRQITATATATKTDEKPAPKKKKKAPKGGKTLLSFGDDEGDVDMPVRPAKPKYNAALVTDTNPPATKTSDDSSKTASSTKQQSTTQTRKRPRSPSPEKERKERVKTPEPASQLPLPDPESPPSRTRSESPSDAEKEKPSKLSRTNAAIEDLKASMRRNVHTGPSDSGRKKSALEAMIPETAIRGRKRGAGGNNTRSNANGLTGFSSSAEAETLKIFNAFKAKLENADSSTAAPEASSSHPKHTSSSTNTNTNTDTTAQNQDDEEAQLCDLHFIANCQSCQTWDTEAGGEDAGPTGGATADDDKGWLTHQLRFGKDMLGKDLNWKREHQPDADSLMVIDPREREKEFSTGGRKKGLQRDRERERKREQAGSLEWDQGKGK